MEGPWKPKLQQRVKTTAQTSNQSAHKRRIGGAYTSLHLALVNSPRHRNLTPKTRLPLFEWEQNKELVEVSWCLLFVVVSAGAVERTNERVLARVDTGLSCLGSC